MKIRGLIFWALVALPACAPDYLDLGYDLPTSTTVKVCTPGESRACYSGPAATENVGICKGGMQTCVTDGSAFGACLGEVLPKPAEDCATPEDDDCDGQAPGCAGQVLWAASYGSIGVEEALGVAVSPAGDIVATGTLSGDLDFGSGPIHSTGGGPAEGTDIFVVKLTPDGQSLFSVHFGDWQSQRGLTVTTNASGDIGVGGIFYGSLALGSDTLGPADDNGDPFVAKLDGKTGAPLWSKGLAADPLFKEELSVVFDPEGNLIVAGGFAGSIDFGAGPVAAVGDSDIFVAKLEGQSGAVLWARTIPAAGAENIHALSVSPTGTLAIAGGFDGTLDLDGHLLSTAGGRDAFLAALDGATGQALWAQALGGSGDDDAVGVASSPDGRLFLTGTLGTGNLDVLIAGFEPDGKPLWTRSFGDSAAQQARSIAVDAFGYLIVVGSFEGTLDFGGDAKIESAGDRDVFVAKLDAAGAPQWSRRFGDSSPQQATSVCVNAGGEVILSASFYGSMDVGAQVLKSAGLLDIALLRLGP